MPIMPLLMVKYVREVMRQVVVLVRIIGEVEKQH
jgi:hypothetical protein